MQIGQSARRRYTPGMHASPSQPGPLLPTLAAIRRLLLRVTPWIAGGVILPLTLGMLATSTDPLSAYFPIAAFVAWLLLWPFFFAIVAAAELLCRAVPFWKGQLTNGNQ